MPFGGLLEGVSERQDARFAEARTAYLQADRQPRPREPTGTLTVGIPNALNGSVLRISLILGDGSARASATFGAIIVVGGRGRSRVREGVCVIEGTR